MGQFKPRNTERARSLRNAATPAERTLWKYLNRSRLGGHKFSRQMPIGPYFADFLCRAEKLVIEIDGFSHDGRQPSDRRRTRELESQGYMVMRFTNDDVLDNIDGVVRSIETALAHPRPLPQAGGEKEAQHGSRPACGRR
ncbi:endonuclease domain-containing protein [uncultured Parasphingopyxis sp.]|uniref:endonuclease domain-containing protein n=1 Tax=uncultured Parasphingopyxis sp. TaxID=1547918 RepID=UPI002632741F|nr:DUF559 domain-containing protein [uncultured Parasphingopyxis sp.]